MNKLTALMPAVATTVFALTFASVPKAAQADETTLVSVNSTGVVANDASFLGAISRTGRFVTFWSRASNLVPGITNDALDIFVHDRKTGETTRVNVDSFGAEGNKDSVGGAISANGRIVAFQSIADNLVLGDTNVTSDVFVHDRKTGETTRVSVDSTGVEGNGFSSTIAISANGRIVAFQSNADNLVLGDTNGASDTFLHDRRTGETTRVNVDTFGVEGNGFSSCSAISRTGRFVAFCSAADNLVPGDTNDALDIFVHDRKTGETTRVNVDSFGVEGNGGSASFAAVAISASGRFVAFQSIADNLVLGDTNVTSDVFVHDRKTGETTRVSVDSTGVEGNGFSAFPAISASGRFVAFGSIADNLVLGDTNGRNDIFVHDRKTGETTRENVDSDGNQAFGPDNSLQPAISASGRFVAFNSDAALTPGAPFDEVQVYVHDRLIRLNLVWR